MTAEQEHLMRRGYKRKKNKNPSQNRANTENGSSRKLPILLERGQMKQDRVKVMVFPNYQVALSSS